MRIYQRRLAEPNPTLAQFKEAIWAIQTSLKIDHKAARRLLARSGAASPVDCGHTHYWLEDVRNVISVRFP